MTTTPLFQGLAQDTTLQALIAQFAPVVGGYYMSGVGAIAQPDVTGRPIVTVQATGQSGSVTLQPQVSDDNGTWTVLTDPATVENVGVATGAQAATITANGTYRIDTKGYPYFRLYQSAGTGSTTLSIGLSSTPGGTRLNTGGPVRIPAQAAGATDPGLQMLGFRSPAAVAARSAAGAYTAFMADQEGKQVVTPHAATEQQWQGYAATATAGTAVPIKAAAAAGIRNYLTAITYNNEGASPALFVTLDGTTTIHRAIVPANDSRHFTFPTPLKGTAATAMNVQGAATTCNASAVGFLGV